MAERTVSVSSAGKTFSFTGWKIGWVSGPADLVAAVRTVKQFLTYVNGAPFQPAVAVGLDLPDSFFAGAASDLAARRDRLCAGLVDAGFTTFRPSATYFVVTDVSELGFDDGAEFCRRLPERCGWWRFRLPPSSTIRGAPGPWCALPSANAWMFSMRRPVA